MKNNYLDLLFLLQLLVLATISIKLAINEQLTANEVYSIKDKLIKLTKRNKKCIFVGYI